MCVFVVDVTSVTFALETARYVHADAVLTHLRHQRTFVNFLGETRHWIDYGSWPITTQR